MFVLPKCQLNRPPWYPGEPFLVHQWGWDSREAEKGFSEFLPGQAFLAPSHFLRQTGVRQGWRAATAWSDPAVGPLGVIFSGAAQGP